MKKKFNLWNIAIAIMLLISVRVSGYAAEVQVFAAASLTDVLNEIGTEYQKQTGDHLVFNYAASSVLERQIEEGAPADVFFSADEAKMDTLEKNKLIVPGTRKSLLSNTLVIIVPEDSKLTFSSAVDLTKVNGYIAIAEPQSVPAGIYAKEYLKKIGIWSKIIDRLAPTENVRAALAVVELGNADACIVYKTDAEISKKVKIAYEVPLQEGPKISYPVAIVAKSKNLEVAKKLLTYLESEAGIAYFKKYGFLIQE
jgi:molybdate transport system substrate-binding protein